MGCRMMHIMMSQTSVKQECIPVGCVPTAAVVATRCQYQGGTHSSGRSKGAQGTRALPPSSGSKFFQFHAVFWEILAKSYVPPPGELAPPPRGNPGSATALPLEADHSPACEQTDASENITYRCGKNQLLTNKIILCSSSLLRIRPSPTHSWSVCLILITKYCVDYTSVISPKFLELSRYSFTY